MEPDQRSTLATMGFVFAVIGLAGIPVPVLNNMTVILAVVGAVLGFIGLFGPRQAMALAAIVIAMCAVLGTLVAQENWSRRIQQIQLDLG